MDLNLLEARKTVDRFEKAKTRTIKQAGHGATVEALSIAQAYIADVIAIIPSKIDAARRVCAENVLPELVPNLLKLDHATLALVALQTVMHSIGIGEIFADAVRNLGGALEAQCWAAGLTKHDPKLAARISQSVKLGSSTIKHRRKGALAMAALSGYRQKLWSSDLKTHAGGWLLDVLLSALPNVFEAHGRGNGKTLYLSEEGAKVANRAVEELMLRNPSFLPMDTAPDPWTALNRGGPKDQRRQYAADVLRSRQKETHAMVRHAIKTGQMAPALAGLNALQAVPWKINTRILDVQKRCVALGLKVPGLPIADLIPPTKDRVWADMTSAEKDLWSLQNDRTRQKNRTLVSERLLLTEDIETAELFKDRFWTPMNMDWRGRVYGMCHFNFQREDRVRALFQFADGEPIGEDGLWWLKVHVANCGDFGKISKRPLEERVKWTEDNLLMIIACATIPVDRNAMWIKADKPFLFLAACLELTDALVSGPGFVTHLPVAFDGSCSGLQHLCAMTRAPEGALVNLTPSDTPQDIYATVALRVNEKITADLTAEFEPELEWKREVAQMALAHGIGRSETKRNVMTYSYGSKKSGMGDQQQSDFMDVLQEEVLTGHRPEHPFGLYSRGGRNPDGRPFAGPAARYLAGHVFDAIEEVISLPAQVMNFLQKIARTMAHEGKAASWVTPTGTPWYNNYRTYTERRLVLWLHDKGVRERHSITTSIREENTIDKARAANGVAPNFVHALDAAHLSLTAGACAREGIRLATVHDSFGCLASRARRVNAVIREEFAAMYEKHDVLQEVLEAAKRDLTQANWHRLPDAPLRGELDINEVKDAVFAFA